MVDVEQLSPPSPTTGAPKILSLLAGVALVGLAAVIGLAWWLGFLTPEPEPASITEAAATVAAESDSGASTATETTVAQETDAAEEATAAIEDEANTTNGIGSIEGNWVIVESDATFVGYRADSQVGEAVGRSPGVTGTLTATESEITSVSIVADMTQLESDSSVRDGHLGDEGIEHNTYPTSSFVLTEPIAIDAIPADGVEESFSIVGDLTVKDITLPVTIELNALVVDDKFIVAGDTEINLDDYGASVSGTNEATMEFSVVFSR